MVVVPFTTSAWFLWCFSIPNVDRWSLSGETYAKINGWVFPASSQNSQVPSKKKRRKKEEKKKSNKCSGCHLNLVSFLAPPQKAFLLELACFRPLIKTLQSLIRGSQSLFRSTPSILFVLGYCWSCSIKASTETFFWGAYKCCQVNNIVLGNIGTQIFA